jgi:hypothetical protein
MATSILLSDADTIILSDADTLLLIRDTGEAPDVVEEQQVGGLGRRGPYLSIEAADYLRALVREDDELLVLI